MPTRRSAAQSTIDADPVTPSPTGAGRTQRKKRSTNASSIRRADSEAEPKPIRRPSGPAREPAAIEELAATAPKRTPRTKADPEVNDVSDPDPRLAADPADDAADPVDGADARSEPVTDAELEAIIGVDDIDDDDVEVGIEGETDADDADETAEPAAEDPPLTGVRAVGRPRSREEEAATLALWQAYKAGPTDALRNQLMERYRHIVNFSAERMHARLPGEVDVDDLKQAGLFGLMDSIDAFDLSRGVKFETFCTARVRGAIFDELRAMDWVPRLVRARTSKVERARKQLEVELGRKPTDEELCRQLGVDQNEFKKIIKDSSPVSTVSLDRKWFETDSSKDVREIDVIKDSKQESPLLQLQRGDLKHLITKGLSRAERLIVVLYYYEGMTMKEIGTTLDLSESRVSQMHSSILARLKAQMQHRDKEF